VKICTRKCYKICSFGKISEYKQFYDWVKQNGNKGNLVVLSLYCSNKVREKVLEREQSGKLRKVW